MNDSFYIFENRHMVYSYFKIIQNFWNEVPYRGLGAEKLSAGG